MQTQPLPAVHESPHLIDKRKAVTGSEAGYTGDEQIEIALKQIVELGGRAQMADLYTAMEKVLNPRGLTLSAQGKASLRFFVNKIAVEAGYVYPYNRDDQGWRITPLGREFLQVGGASLETAVNVDTGTEEQVLSNTARGAAFESFVLRILKAVYPLYAWYHQGIHKNNERGLDFIGSRIGDAGDEPKCIGVQVKFHKPENAPTSTEWLKFLSGCFARRVDTAIFVTTGQLTAEQRREAQEARIVVIEGRDEITRIAELHNVAKFKLFDSRSVD